MENNGDTQKPRMVLAVREEWLERMHLEFRLECLEGFWLSVTMQKERACVFVGSDLERAWELFCAVSRGGVTPCTLEDVCRDYFAFAK